MQHSVWSLGIRCLHWTLAISMLMAFFTHEIDGPLHEWPGYVALASAVLRLAGGFLPNTRSSPARYSRFSNFLKGPKEVGLYCGRLLRGQAPRYLGHSPLAACLVLALLLVTALAGVSGWMLLTDRFFGVAWVMQAHDVLIHGTWRHRENLLAAMLHGKKVIRAGSGKDGVA